MDAKFFEQGQLGDLGEDEDDNEGHAQDIALEAIDVSKWDQRNGYWSVPEEHRRGVLVQHHASQVAGHCGRHRTQELVSCNFMWDRWSEDVANYVAGRIKCQESKADRHSRQTKLVPIPTGE